MGNVVLPGREIIVYAHHVVAGAQQTLAEMQAEVAGSLVISTCLRVNAVRSVPSRVADKLSDSCLQRKE